MHTEIDFSFLPSGTRVFSPGSSIASVSAPRRIVIASDNSDMVLAMATEWLEIAGSAVEILWNPVSNPDFAYSMIGLSETASYSAFWKSNLTAHLAVANAESILTVSSASRLTPATARLLEDAANENVSIPPKTFKQLVWRYSYLLDQIETLSNQVETLRKKLDQSSKDAVAREVLSSKQAEIGKLTSVNQTLVNQLDEINGKMSELDARYARLAESKLGSLTLKYWAFRKRNK
ncbi:hypothetical protein [Corynebacterium guangdongense]|uniref:ABC-type antimicrobial peptide transport system permease subunit n=1 Tax=Corynebacterium guangdongense TaxID=1783348 RepID=A0ABU1ZYP7_9CORY|nr:hypothetical protein [Corynebacterium guangdongense]MDR7329885.1 ABC-type antimicrobial peptide transport system permease subunit [Corynebacterium guangdongense]